jgi:Phage antirepressor protein KilAC domain
METESMPMANDSTPDSVDLDDEDEGLDSYVIEERYYRLESDFDEMRARLGRQRRALARMTEALNMLIPGDVSGDAPCASTHRVVAGRIVFDEDGSMTITEAAAALGVDHRDIASRIYAVGWLSYEPGLGRDFGRGIFGCGRIGTADALARGVISHKVAIDFSGRSVKITENVRVTPRGLRELAVLIKGDSGVASTT